MFDDLSSITGPSASSALCRISRRVDRYGLRRAGGLLHENGYVVASPSCATSKPNSCAGTLQGLFDPAIRAMALLRVPHQRVGGPVASAVSTRWGRGASPGSFTTFSGIPLSLSRRASCSAARCVFLARSLFCKPARHGGVVAWHQDYSYWTRTKPMAHLTCAGSDSTRRRGTTAVCSTFPGAIAGPAAGHGIGGRHGGDPRRC